jgi:hypothetical protein
VDFAGIVAEGSADTEMAVDTVSAEIELAVADFPQSLAVANLAYTLPAVYSADPKAGTAVPREVARRSSALNSLLAAARVAADDS